MKRPLGVESALSELRASGAKALATALVTGIDNVGEETTALTQRQQVAFATMTVMAYEQILEGCRNLEFDADVLQPNVDALRANIAADAADEKGERMMGS